MNKILIVGTVAFDSIETPFGKTDKILGGSAPYIGLSAAQFDVNIALVSVVGGDFPNHLLKKFEAQSIDTSAIKVLPGEKTFFWSGRYHDNMNSRDTIATELNVLSKFKPVVPIHFKDANVVVLGNLAPNNQMNVISQITNKNAFVILDTMNFWMDNALEELLEVLKKVDVISINEEESRQLTSENSLALAAKKIHQMGPKFVVIKKGEHGVLLFHKDKIFSAPALPLEVVFDPTGAGDTFAGGFAGFLTKTNDFSFDNMKRALIYGSVMASFCVEKFGLERLFDIDAKSLINRLKDFENLTQFEIEHSF